jgi:tetratricopeptide (TPR) repeat protein
MSRAINIELETVKQLTAQDELALVQAAHARNPSPTMRWRLASLLVLNDDAAAVIALLSDQPDLSSREEMTLAQAWLARESAEGDVGAHAATDRALALSRHPDERAAALALRAKAETRMGDVATAHATLTEALALDPHNKDACKRLATLNLAAGDADAVLAMYDDLTAKGAAHSRLFAAKALAHAQRDERDQLRSIMGADDFFRAGKLPPPPGWDSIESFNAALAEQLLAHPGLRFDRYGTASELTWRIDSPLSRAAPLVRVLLDAIAEAINAHVGQVGGTNHPWAAARPDDAILRAWCVITESDGFENWHVHQFGWLSGAYYVRVPDSIAHGDTEAGCIALGLPEDLAGEEAAAAYGTEVVRPQDGLCLMFPSHTYHRTFPHGVRDRRICVAFDLKPRVAMPEDEAEAA